jgi:hypothetical protein
VRDGRVTFSCNSHDFRRKQMRNWMVEARAAMEKHLQQLRAERDRAVREFLSIDGWACSKAKIQEAVNEMINDTKLSTSSLAFLLQQISHVSARTEPARRLNDLTRAIAALKVTSEGNALAEQRRASVSRVD